MKTIVALAASVLIAGCSVDEAAVPAVTGPSEFGLSVAMTASPNQLPRDGQSQAVVIIVARDVQGRGVAGQRFAVTLPVNVPSGTTLSAIEVTTDPSGQATVVVTAPTPSSTGNTIVINALPVGANLDDVVSRQISIRLTPVNASAPSPSFTRDPSDDPEVGQLVRFTSTTTDEGVACLDTCTYFWDFGGEATATGRIVTHRFRAGGSYVVALTATDAVGAFATTRQTVTVRTTGQPIPVSFTVSPASPNTGQATTFTASATPATNHRIVSYTWNWGDGTTSQTTAPAIQHTFSNPGQFLVTLTVRDDFGQTSDSRQVVTVGTGLTAEFIFSTAIAGQDTTFDASRSFTGSGATIQLYTWSWGDGSSNTNTTSPTTTHKFATTGSFSVTLTVFDSQGRTDTETKTVTVGAAP